MAVEKQTLILAPGIYSIGMWRLVNIGNYENVTVGFAEGFSRSETDPHDAYVKIKAMLDNWVHELPARKPDPVAPPQASSRPLVPTRQDVYREQALQREVVRETQSAKLNAVMDALGGHASRLIITEHEDMIILRTRGKLERETWGDIDTLVRGQGGSWRGTKDGLPGKEVHWEIPK
jgi:hypothetical protein